MHEKRTAVSIHSAGSSFDDHLNPDHIELRSRTKATLGYNSNGGWRREDDSPTNGNSFLASSNRVVVDHYIQPEETLNSIALLYSVQVGEIKRANNLVADQEIFGLPLIRIPVSRLQKEILMNSKNAEQEQVPFHQHCNKPSSSSPNPSVHEENKQHWSSNHKAKVTNKRSVPSSSRQYNKDDYEVPLLGDHDDEFSMEGTEEAKEAIEDLFEKADATVAAARENLPSPSLEGGGFHFIDAKSPDNTQRIWLLVMLVIFMFVVIPLLVTFLEEKSEAEEALHPHHHHSSSQMA